MSEHQSPPPSSDPSPATADPADFNSFKSRKHSLDPEYIGHYRILQRIGEGGMATARVSNKTGEPIAIPLPGETRPQNPGAVRFSIAMLTPILLNLHQYAEAEALSRESLELGSRDPQPAHLLWLSPDAKFQLGTALVGLNRPAEAEPLLQEGYETMDDLPFGVLSRKHDIFQRLVKLYEARNEPEKAKEWRSRLAAKPAPAKPTSTRPSDR